MSLEEWKALAETIQAFATVVALVVGAIWTYVHFGWKREPYPRAAISHTFQHALLTDEQRLVHVESRIANIGQRLLILRQAEVRFSPVRPISPELLDRLNDGTELTTEADHEINWPGAIVRKPKWEDGTAEIEPGETEVLHVDFVVSADVEVACVYTFVPNIRKRDRTGWAATSFLTLRPNALEDGDALDAETHSANCSHRTAGEGRQAVSSATGPTSSATNEKIIARGHDQADTSRGATATSTAPTASEAAAASTTTKKARG